MVDVTRNIQPDKYRTAAESCLLRGQLLVALRNLNPENGSVCPDVCIGAAVKAPDAELEEIQFK
jgi:hypothetical protein